MAKAKLKVQEKQWFEPDRTKLETPKEKNDRLSDLLVAKWNPLDIVSIRRIEIGAQGWEATHRTVG